MKYPSTRVIFDRSKTASDIKQAPVYIEVVFNQKKRYVPTGVRVRKGEYDAKKEIIVRRHDCLTLTEMIRNTQSKIQKYIFDLQEADKTFSFDAFDLFMRTSEKTSSFLDFIRKTITERTDIELSTRKQHLIMLKKVERYGRLSTFVDVNEDGIRAFNEWLIKVDMPNASLDSIYGVHKRLKPYVREAKRMRLIKENPYDYFTPPRGRDQKLRYLLPDELERIETVDIHNASIARIRDLFVFACYTGMAYADIARFDASQLQNVNLEFVKNKKTCNNLLNREL